MSASALTRPMPRGANQQKAGGEGGDFIIDEPRAGIDIKTKAYLHELVREVAREDAAVLLIASEMAEMITLAERILVMHGFRIIGEVATIAITMR